MNDLPRNPAQSAIPPLTDSPWFWVMTFASMALVALLAIDHKFGTRQSGIERQYQGRQFARLREAQQAGAEAPQPDDEIHFSTNEDTLITLRPLRWLAGLILTVSSFALARERRKLNRPDFPHTPPQSIPPANTTTSPE